MSGMRLRFLERLLLASRMALAIGSGCAAFTDVLQAEPAHPPELVKVEGRRVEAVTEGTGTPAVVFESGSNGSSPWERMRREKPLEEVKKLGLPPTVLAEWMAISETIDEAHRASLPRVPTVVLTSTQPVGQYPLQDDQAMQVWCREHDQLVARTPGATSCNRRATSVRSWTDTTVRRGHQKSQYLHRPEQDRIEYRALGSKPGPTLDSLIIREPHENPSHHRRRPAACLRFPECPCATSVPAGAAPGS